MLLLAELRLQGGDVDVLHGFLGAQGLDGGEAAGLAEDHELRLHADGAVGDVRGGHADGDEEVFALAALRDEAAVGNLVGAHGEVEVAFVDDAAVVVDEALDRVGIHDEGAHADGVGLGEVLRAIVLAHDVTRRSCGGLRARRGRRANGRCR